MEEFIIENDLLKIVILDYGARIKEIYSKKHKKNIVLCYEDNKKYLEDKNFYGATIGPNANRIKNAQFKLGDKIIKWEKNDKNSNLHSGKYGFDKKYFIGNVINEKELNMCLNDTKPFSTSVKIKFFLDENALKINYKAFSKEKSILNLTNHTYFNLSCEETVDNHIFKLYSEKYTPFDSQNIPTGEIKNVNFTEFDLRKPKTLKTLMKESINTGICKMGYDINYIRLKNNKNISKLATVKYKDIILEVFSDAEAFQFYTGGNIVEDGKKKRRKGFCIEPQCIPNSVNDNPEKVLKDVGKYFNMNIIYKII